MSKIINVRLELDKIDKTKIVVGEKGKYLNIIVAERKRNRSVREYPYCIYPAD